MSKKPKAAKVAPVKTSKTANTKTDPKLIPKNTPGKGVKPVPPQAIKGAVRENSKQAQLIDMLKRSSGATIPQIMDATGWQQHTVRGFLSGTVKKKLGFKLLSEKNESGTRIYRIKAA